MLHPTSATMLKTMPSLHVYLHFVWTTKNRFPFLPNPEIRKEVWEHIKTNAVRKNIRILAINGHNDHCHCLISLNKDMTISKLAQLLKGECSHWINESGLIKEQFPSFKFDWQNEYHVESVSPSLLAKVIRYIDNQEAHHKR